MKSIQWKLVAIYLTLVLIVMVVSGTFIVLRTQQIEYANVKDDLSRTAIRIQDEVILGRTQEVFGQGLEQFTKEGSTSAKMQIHILDPLGNKIASTVVQPEQKISFSSNAIIRAASGKGEFDQYPKQEMDAIAGRLKEWIGYAYPVRLEGKVTYIIYIQKDIAQVRESVKVATRTIVLGVMIALFFTCVIGFIFANTLTGPIIALTNKAKEMAQGNLDQRILAKSDDEIGQLTETFNHMAKELNKTLSTISSEKNKLEIVLYHMADGILAFDADGNLIHMNPAAHKILGIQTLPGDFQELFGMLDIEVDFSKFRDVEPNEIKQHILSVGKKYVHASFAPYVNERKAVEGVIAVMHDVTEQTKLEEMRKEFVANVSHELRTPLTTVKSYTETLLDGALEEKDTAVEFLEIINGEADRMTLLVQDLLQLSKLDNKQQQFHMQSIHISQLLENVIRQHQLQAVKKRQILKYMCSEKLPMLMIDPDRITQVLNNLLNNAIKYSGEEAEIEVVTEETEQYLKIMVRDTGIGIPEEDLPRIFERFYRVDKARSRAMGGTGLGLSIAKEIMDVHGGKITAESRYGEGTAMTLWFPKKCVIQT